MPMKVSVSKNGKLYVRRTVTGGMVQKAFAEKIGKPVGACYGGKVQKGTYGYSRAELKKAMQQCSEGYKGAGKLGFTARDPHAGKTMRSTPIV